MILNLNKAGGGYKQTYLPPLAELREQLRDNAEALFREQWGEPERTNSNEWRAKANTARAMVLRGHDRGAWTDHKSGDRGGPMEFFAIYALGWPGVPTDNDGKRALRTEAARWLGIDVSKPVSEAELELRRADSALKAAQRAKAAEADPRCCGIRTPLWWPLWWLLRALSRGRLPRSTCAAVRSSNGRLMPWPMCRLARCASRRRS